MVGFRGALRFSTTTDPHCDVTFVLQFAQRTRNVELGPAKKMIFFRNVEETVSKLRHDIGVLQSQRDALQAALAEATDGRKKAEERIKALAGDARKHYETREHVLVEDRKAMKAQFDEAVAALKQERMQRKVVNRNCWLVIECFPVASALSCRVVRVWVVA